MNLHSSTHANTYIFAHCKKPLHRGWMFGLSYTSVRNNLQLMWLLQRMLFLNVVSFCNWKTAAHWSCGPERRGTWGRQMALQLECCIFRYFLFIYNEFCYPFHACTYTHPLPPPSFLPYFPLHLISEFHSFYMFFLPCSNSFGRYWLNKTKFKASGGIERSCAVKHRALLQDYSHRYHRGSCVNYWNETAVSHRKSGSGPDNKDVFAPQRLQRGCIRLCLNYVSEELFHRTYGLLVNP